MNRGRKPKFFLLYSICMCMCIRIRGRIILITLNCHLSVNENPGIKLKVIRGEIKNIKIKFKSRASRLALNVRFLIRLGSVRELFVL
jgi:hypothetical protein